MAHISKTPTGGGQKKSAHRQKYSQFDIIVTGTAEMKENRIFFKSSLGHLMKKLLTY